jgi:hypothetical protein
LLDSPYLGFEGHFGASWSLIKFKIQNSTPPRSVGYIDIFLRKCDPFVSKYWPSAIGKIAKIFDI